MCSDAGKALVKQFVSGVLKNIAVAEGYRLLEFEWSAQTAPLPGQFVTLWNRSSTDPLLRRPFAVSAFDRDSNSCEIVYQLRGKATKALSACRKGDPLDVVGPLGHGFPSPQSGKLPYLLAGGIGFGPVYYLANTLVSQGARPVAIIGAQKAAFIPDVPYGGLGNGTRIFRFCTDDGSRGYHGTVIDMLQSLDDLTPDSAEVFACGPRPMLAAAARFCDSAGITCWVAMEQVMGCGVGACMGCAIQAREPGEYLRVCTEGPVFNAKDLLWK